MLLTIMGSIGIGIVWGWLFGNLTRGTHRRPVLDALLLSAALLLISLESFLFGGWLAVAFLLAATGLALLFHIVWLRGIHDRINSSMRS